VSDKDGITAALFVATMAAHLKANDHTLQDQLDRLATEHGVHATKQVSVRVTDLSRITKVMAALRTQPPTFIGGLAVTRFVDLEEGTDLPPTDGLLFELEGNARVIIRPSGTEPKVKAYLQSVIQVTEDLTAARAQADLQISTLEADVRTWLR
jgi:phosphomannomutase